MSFNFSMQFTLKLLVKQDLLTALMEMGDTKDAEYVTMKFQAL